MSLVSSRGGRLLVLLLAVAAISFPVVVWGASVYKHRVTFNPGQVSAPQTGMVLGGVVHDYFFRATRGQNLAVRVTGEGTRLSVTRPGGAVLYSGGQMWRGRLLVDGEYHVLVTHASLTGSMTPFTLAIELQ